MDWQVGDLAVCVDGEEWFNPDGSLSAGPDPRTGETYEVSGSEIDEEGDLCLFLIGFAEDSYWEEAFRKIIPDKHEQCEPEFVTLLKRSKRKVAA